MAQSSERSDAHVRRVLSALAVLNDSPSAALFALGEKPRLIAAVAVEAHHLAAVERAWSRHADLLADGEAVRIASVVVVPVVGSSGLFGLLCLDRFDEMVCPTTTREALLANLSRALVRPPMSAHGLELPAAEDAEKARLLQRLDRNEWNIARVARLYQVTRKTIYEWLERYDIPRKRVPRGA
jgi:transcriptional regulator with GAF, ATPase, and Fis domain